MHPSSLRAFQRHQEHDLKHPGSVDLITTKQNKQNKPNYLPPQIDVMTEGHSFPKKALALCPFFCYQVVKFRKKQITDLDTREK